METRSPMMTSSEFNSVEMLPVDTGRKSTHTADNVEINQIGRDYRVQFEVLIALLKDKLEELLKRVFINGLLEEIQVEI